MSHVYLSPTGETVAVERALGFHHSSITLRSQEVVCIDGGDIFLRDALDIDTHHVSPTAAELRAIAAELIRYAEAKEEKAIRA